MPRFLEQPWGHPEDTGGNKIAPEGPQCSSCLGLESSELQWQVSPSGVSSALLAIKVANPR